jgi:hypothetical protein
MADDRRVEPPFVVLREQARRRPQVHFQHQSGILPVQARQHGRQVGHGHVLADAQRQPMRTRRNRAERPFVRIEQRARGRQEILAVGRELHDARRAREQRLAEVRFEPFQLQADGRLGGAERVRGAREAREIGHQHERAHRIEVENFHFECKWMKYPEMTVHYSSRPLT